MPRARRVAPLALAGALVGGSLWARTHPSACPYSARWLLRFPRPYLDVARLHEALEPRPGERVLELGPGDGYHALSTARALEPGGTLDAFDLQQEMLDALMRRASEEGVDNIVPRQGDATRLPYEDASFDGACLVTVLGEVPDQDGALRELRRVLKPGGRVVFGESSLDPQLVTLGALKRRAEAAGLELERVVARPLVGECARFSAGER